VAEKAASADESEEDREKAVKNASELEQKLALMGSSREQAEGNAQRAAVIRQVMYLDAPVYIRGVQCICMAYLTGGQEKAPGAVIDWPLFMAMMAHKMGNDTAFVHELPRQSPQNHHTVHGNAGNDTAFVLAYSTIMLNTDAHNPRLTGQVYTPPCKVDSVYRMVYLTGRGACRRACRRSSSSSPTGGPPIWRHSRMSSSQGCTTRFW
jgi:hypothetical protein